MNEFSTYEFAVSQKITGKWLAARAGLIAFYCLYPVIVLLFGMKYSIVAPLLAFIPISLWIIIFITWRYVAIDYEYSVTSGTLTFTKIYGNRSRRKIFEMKLKDAVRIAPLDLEIEGLNDSKKLSEKKREALYDIIIEKAIYSIAWATPAEIDELNILNATMLAMRRAVEGLPEKADFALIDGNRETDFCLPVKTVVKGDSLSANIAAASVLAKVSRDDLMEAMAKEYPQYGFEIHKGYGTKAHYEALRTYGPCPIHRLSFLKKFYGNV